jgi:VIT1/CCC1 family predicted Fe2+/Mn2+ transporter
MSRDPEAEIRASVGAHADLGPGYEDAVAEGLVERIGAEIDKRIEARLAQTGAAGAAGAADPAGYPGSQGGYQGYLGPVLPPGYQLGPPPVRPSPVGARNVATTITALGSVALGVAATAIVSYAGSLGGQGLIILLIWVAIAIINVAYARRS